MVEVFDNEHEHDQNLLLNILDKNYYYHHQDEIISLVGLISSHSYQVYFQMVEFLNDVKLLISRDLMQDYQRFF